MTQTSNYQPYPYSTRNGSAVVRLQVQSWSSPSERVEQKHDVCATNDGSQLGCACALPLALPRRQISFAPSPKTLHIISFHSSEAITHRPTEGRCEPHLRKVLSYGGRLSYLTKPLIAAAAVRRLASAFTGTFQTVLSQQATINTDYSLWFTV